MAIIKANSKATKGLALMIYGESNAGKTTIATSTNKKVLVLEINNESGTKDLGLSDNVFIEDDLNTVNKIKLLVDKQLEKHFQEFDVIVLDNITKLHNVWTETWGNKKKDFDYWSGLQDIVLSTCSAMKKYAVQYGKLAIFIAHQETDKENQFDDEIIAALVYPAIRHTIRHVLLNDMDYVIHAYIDGEVEVGEDDRSKLEVEYKVHIGKHPIFFTKFRAPRHVVFDTSMTMNTEYLLNDLMKELVKK